MIYTAEVIQEDAVTRLEWVVDSDFRFFPTMPDDIFGYLLHPVDLATNKVMAAAGRREVRDLVDLVTVHTGILPLGAVIWAAVEKSPGFTPEGLIAEIRRNANYPSADWRALLSSEPIDPKDITFRLRSALDEAETFVIDSPERERRTSEIGHLIMEHLKKHDKVAYVRFASVYLDFKDVREFLAELQDLLNHKDPATAGKPVK